MTAEQAAALGYEVVLASPFEAGLVKNGKGIRTWWASDFDGNFPGLEHPIIMDKIKQLEGIQ